ncbi:MAG: hypothetical protein LBS09_00980 [Bacteroidales bacterium]|jgi:hypothetical protein|nr:hypothetical protein [Bacteroidales bacterium]
MKNKLIYYAVLLAFFVAGCSKDNEKEGTILKVIESRFDITVKGGTGTIIVETNGVLDAKSDADWCEVVSVSDNTVTVAIAAYDGLPNRTATVTLTAGDRKEKVAVTQTGTKFFATPNSFESGSKTATYKTVIYHDMAFTVQSAAEWISGTVNTDTVIITVDDNKTLSNRTGAMEITAGIVTIPITVTQSAMRFSLSQNSINTGKDAAVYKVAVTHDFDFEAATADSWLHVSVTAGNGTTPDTAVIVIDALDPNASERQGVVSVTSGSETLTVAVKQVPRILTYAELPGEYTITAELYSSLYYSGTTFTATLTLEVREEGKSYNATIDGYFPDNAFFADTYGGQYEQYPLVINYVNGSLVIPNGQLVAKDADEDFDSPTAWIWEVYYFAVSQTLSISDDSALTYVGKWDGALDTPVFTFDDGGVSSDFAVMGFVPYWWNRVPDDENYDFPDYGLILYDWVLTKNDPIP